MKFYNTQLSFQNFGSKWLLILCGKTEDIEQSFNSLFNNSAVAQGAEIKYQDHLQMVGICWSSKKAMRRYFINRAANNEYINDHKWNKRRKWPFIIHVKKIASRCFQEFLNPDNQETFFDMTKEVLPETYASGRPEAERPDMDLKDAILIHAHTNHSKE